MPIRYVQTLGAVAGIVQTVNRVEITCSKPSPLALTASGKPTLAVSASKPVPLALTMELTLHPSYGGD